MGFRAVGGGGGGGEGPAGAAGGRGGPAPARPRPRARAQPAGTGPYELTEAVPGDQYTYQIREGYTWGPNGATTAEEGMPDTVVMKVIQNQGTAANLLIAGEVNAATIQGPDAKRLQGADLFATETPAIVGEQWYNHN